jgi:hypothetical protein
MLPWHSGSVAWSEAFQIHTMQYEPHKVPNDLRLTYTFRFF